MRHEVGETVADRFQICALLAEGGMAEIYRALDTTTGRELVLKLPRVATAVDLVAYNLYRRESDLIAGLDHPGLQRLLSDPKAPFMVLDYVPGESLRSYMQRHRPLPIDEVLDIGIQLADTLQYVHAQGIVHRDVKPENIIVGPEGHVTLMDFGIALRQSSRRLTFLTSRTRSALLTTCPRNRSGENMRMAAPTCMHSVWALDHFDSGNRVWFARLTFSCRTTAAPRVAPGVSTVAIGSHKDRHWIIRHVFLSQRCAMSRTRLQRPSVDCGLHRLSSIASAPARSVRPRACRGGTTFTFAIAALPFYR
jgi:serine/threonine protein kinase